MEQLIGLERIVAGRFNVDRIAGSGGMGTVYRALDLHTGKVVALKLLHSHALGRTETDRFIREATLLAELHHPRIVSYVAHGQTERGQPFLAMEWLDGEDLGQRLSRGTLGLSESLTLLRYVADALAVAHRCGIVHRDLKPSNIFLERAEIEQVKILDFGIARRTSGSRQMTRTGFVIGTPEYMAPEQARGLRDMGPSADIFSLGCVLFECLTGQPPFSAEHIAAVLAKILFDDPPCLRSLRAEIPESVDALLTQMLAKDPQQRLVDADALLFQLGNLGEVTVDQGLPTMAVPTAMGIASDDQGLVSIIVATPAISLAEETTLEPHQDASHQATFASTFDALKSYGIACDFLTDGSLVATLVHSRGEAQDQAAQAARAAMLLAEKWPDSIVVLVTGRGLIGDRVPVGEALDRAGILLRKPQQRPGSRGATDILIDDLTAKLLETSFRVRPDAAGHHVLTGEELSADVSRPLLGKPTPCVGRDQELAILESMFRGCVEDSAPRVALVVAPPGMGKSRLRHEFLRRLETHRQDYLVLLGRSDPMSAGSSCGLLGQALRRFCGVQDGESAAARSAKLTQRISHNLPVPIQQRVTEFIGELCKVPVTAEPSPKLRAARQNPRIMSDQLGLALLDFLRAECQVRPVLLVLEDLHWGDKLSVRLVDLALRGLTEQPLMVLALARPEVEELYPRIWAGLTQQITLQPLSKRARERLVQQVLGQQCSPVTISRIVEQSAGNGLLLEELIRAVAEGHGNAPPDTVMAMLQARVGNQEPATRRVLRAASVLGETFWDGGVRMLLAGMRQSDNIEDRLELLIEREILERRSESRFPSQREYRFRHTLMRDAAYGLLSEEDRQIGHRLAGEFLLRMGESNQVVLAEHAYRGGQLSLAIPYFVAAAEQALDGSDLSVALHLAEQGISCAAQGEQLGALLGVRAAAYLWRSEFPNSHQVGSTALALLPKGSRRWCRAILTLFVSSTYLGESSHFAQLVEVFRTVDPVPEAASAYIEAAAWLVLMASFVGDRELGRFFLQRMESLSDAMAEQDLSIRGWLAYAHAVFCHWVENDMWLKRSLSNQAIQIAEQVGDRRLLGFSTVALGLAVINLGEFVEGANILRTALTQIRNLPDETILAGTAMGFLSLGYADQEDPSLLGQAEEMAAACIKSVPSAAPAVGFSCITLSRVLLARGSLDEAEAMARRALGTLRVEPVICLTAYSALLRVLLVQGRIADACSELAAGLRLLGSLAPNTSTEVEFLRTVAEVQLAAGEQDAAHQTLRRGLAALRQSADKIPDLIARQRYLTKVPVHAHCLALAHSWWNEPQL
jgi:hypothetical protein